MGSLRSIKSVGTFFNRESQKIYVHECQTCMTRLLLRDTHGVHSCSLALAKDFDEVPRLEGQGIPSKTVTQSCLSVWWREDTLSVYCFICDHITDYHIRDGSPFPESGNLRCRSGNKKCYRSVSLSELEREWGKEFWVPKIREHRPLLIKPKQSSFLERIRKLYNGQS
jgi:hypothetical protein